MMPLPQPQLVEVKFLLEERVRFTDDKAITARVIEIAVQPGRTMYRIAWIHNGDLKLEYVDGFLLELAP